jgi:hypothetical protein
MQGRLTLRVREADGRTVAERRARNIVLRQGASIIAGLFAGAAGSSAITHVQVGFAKQTATPEATALTPPPTPIAAEALRTSLTSDQFRIVADQPAAVLVAIDALFRPTVELQDVTEAGLMAGDKVYNQVVFEPVTLRPGQNVTFFWEVEFPFGR